jgi:molybdopterin synthase sulfur carrier subunit
MPVFVRIPTPLRRLTNGHKNVETEGKNVSEVFLELNTKYPGFLDELYDKEKKQFFFNVYLNKEEIRVLNRVEGSYEIDLNIPVKDGDELSLVAPIAGGIEINSKLF